MQRFNRFQESHWHSVLSIKIRYTASESQLIHWWTWTQSSRYIRIRAMRGGM